jgi:hypothetical protein
VLAGEQCFLEGVLGEAVIEILLNLIPRQEVRPIRSIDPQKLEQRNTIDQRCTV